MRLRDTHEDVRSTHEDVRCAQKNVRATGECTNKKHMRLYSQNLQQKYDDSSFGLSRNSPRGGSMLTFSSVLVSVSAFTSFVPMSALFSRALPPCGSECFGDSHGAVSTANLCPDVGFWRGRLPCSQQIVCGAWSRLFVPCLVPRNAYQLKLMLL